MILDEFTRVCQDEWLANASDVTALELTGESYAELVSEAVSQPQLIGEAWQTNSAGDATAWNVTKLINPVTRSQVLVSGVSAVDMVIVRKPPIGVAGKRKEDTRNEGVPGGGVRPAS